MVKIMRREAAAFAAGEHIGASEGEPRSAESAPGVAPLVPAVQSKLGMAPLLQVTLSDNTRITFGQLAALA